MSKFSVVIENITWSAPSPNLPLFFATEVDHDDEDTAVAIAVLQCEIHTGVEIFHRNYSSSVCLIEDDMVN